MLDYTMSQLLTQQAEIERDFGPLDPYGGEAKTDRQVISTTECRFWWWKAGGARSASKEYSTPERSIDFTGGGALFRNDVDIKDYDFIANFLEEDDTGTFVVVVKGPFRVVNVARYEEHIEVALMRP